MSRWIEWHEENAKWIELSDLLSREGWSITNPRKLKRQMYADRAVFYETDESISKDRTIYAFAVHWKKPPIEGAIQVWVHPASQDKIGRESILLELERKMNSRR